jgi:hypothetical protein
MAVDSVKNDASACSQKSSYKADSAARLDRRRFEHQQTSTAQRQRAQMDQMPIGCPAVFGAVLIHRGIMMRFGNVRSPNSIGEDSDGAMKHSSRLWCEQMVWRTRYGLVQLFRCIGHAFCTEEGIDGRPSAL